MSYQDKAAKALEDGAAESVSVTLLRSGKYEVVVTTGDGLRTGIGATDEEALDAALGAEETAEPVDTGEATPKPAHAHRAGKASADR